MLPTLPHLFAAVLALAALNVSAQDYGYRDDAHAWSDDGWWSEGILADPVNHPVEVTWSEYEHDDLVFPVMVARPADGQRYPAVLFGHGRRGLDEFIQLHVKRLAARGFVVLAPDLFIGRFISTHPIEHDYETEGDFNAALDVLLARDDIRAPRACVYSHTRGGYYALKVAVSFARQHADLACYVSYYPHLQDPNASEAMQVYQYAAEVEKLDIPTLIFVGEKEQYQRARGIHMAVDTLRERGRPAQLVVYPGVGRGFEFRGPPVRTFADDLAAKDALQRAARFMHEQLR
jgi:carboxymethylenebutenolidase